MQPAQGQSWDTIWIHNCSGGPSGLYSKRSGHTDQCYNLFVNAFIIKARQEENNWLEARLIPTSHSIPHHPEKCPLQGQKLHPSEPRLALKQLHSIGWKERHIPGLLSNKKVLKFYSRNIFKYRIKMGSIGIHSSHIIQRTSWPPFWYVYTRHVYIWMHIHIL